MDQQGKQGAHSFRPFHLTSGEQKSRCHAQGRQLVRCEQELDKLRPFPSFPLGTSHFIESLGHGKAEEHNHQNLGHCNELYIGKAHFSI